MTRHAQAVFWTAAYLVLVAAPVFLVADAAVPSGLFWVEFSVALGFASVGMLGMPFLLTARFRRAAAPLGTDILYCFHRCPGYLVLADLGLHAGLVSPALSRPPVVATVALLAAAVPVGSSVARQELGLPYGG